MAIDFSLINTKQPIGGVVGTLPASNAPSALDSLASGIMSGAQAGSQIASNMQNIAASKQNMEINKAQEGRAAELFPIQKENAQNIATQSGVEARAAEQKEMDANTLRQKSAQGIKVWEDSYQKLDPVGYAKYQNDKAEYENKKADTALKYVNSRKELAAAMQNIDFIGGQMASDAAQADADKPGSGAAVYKLKLDRMRIQDPEMAKTFPQEWSPGTNGLLKAAALSSTADALEKAQKDKVSSTGKDLQRMASLQTKQESGKTLTRQEEIELKGYQDNQAARSRGMQTGLTPSQQINVSTTTDRLKNTGEAARAATQNLATFDQMEKTSDQALSGSGAAMELKLRKILDYAGFKTDGKTAASEQFNALAKQGQITAQTLMKGSTSNNDMSLIAETGAQLDNTLAGRRMIINMSAYKSKMEQQYNAYLNAYQNKNGGSLDGADEGWNNFIQSRNDFDPKTKKFNREGINRKAWEAYLDPNKQAPQQTTPISPQTQQMQQTQPQATGGMITIRNNKTGETRQVTLEEAKQLGAQ